MSNEYEMFRNSFVAMLTEKMPGITVEQMQEIISCMDVCAAPYEIKRAELALSVPVGEVPELIKLYIATKTVEGQSRESLNNRLTHLKAFCRYVKKPLDKIEPQDIRVFLYQYQQDRGICSASLDKLRSEVCSLFHWCAAEGYLDRDPAITIKPIKCEKKQRQSLSQIELEYIRKACQTIREKAMIEFMYSTGCRVSEMCIVKLSDVNFQTDEVHLFGKGRKHRTSYLNAKAHVALQEYLSVRQGNSDYLFVSDRRPHERLGKAGIESIVRDIRERADITKAVTPHILRHTTATQAVRHGMPIEEVQKLLGHENVATTMIYVETAQDDVRSGHAKAVV